MANQKRKQAGRATSVVRTLPPPVLPEFFHNRNVLGAIIFGMALLLYANTLGHGFVLDDDIVIRDNMFTQKGIAGIPGILGKDTFFGYFKVEGKDALVSGGRYRPLTLVMFAVIFELFGANTFVFHLFTVLLFAVTGLVLFRLLFTLLIPRGEVFATLLAFSASLIFVAHPIHTEVVANIKGCDEIVTLLGSLGACWLVLRAVDTGRMGWSVLSGVVFFLSCLSKEKAATIVVVIPLALWFFRGISFPRVLRATFPVWLAFLIFFLIRGSILGWRFGGAPMELMNNPYLKLAGNEWVSFTVSERLATIFYTLGKYLVLLFFPHPLTHDYYPRHIDIMTFGNGAVLGSLGVYLFLAYYAFRGIGNRDVIRFGILFFMLTLSIVSNVVFPIGTNMGERFAFMPSVGFCLVIAAFLVRLWQSGRPKFAYTIVVLLLLLFSGKTVMRNVVWQSNERLFLTDVSVSGNSAKIRNACGGVLLDKAAKETDKEVQRRYCEEAIIHLNKGAEIYPNYKDLYISRGGCHFLLERYDAAISDYRTALRFVSGESNVPTLLAMALRERGKFQGEKRGDAPGALPFLEESWKISAKDGETARLLGVANGIMGRKQDAIVWFQRAVDLSPENASYLYDLGTAYYLAGDVQRQQDLHARAKAMDPKLGKR
jgi:Flp pilus assembly protein TadD